MDGLALFDKYRRQHQHFIVHGFIFKDGQIVKVEMLDLATRKLYRRKPDVILKLIAEKTLVPWQAIEVVEKEEPNTGDV